MELNAYQPCPCHAEQKIKFCCGKQIVDDLNQVMALARGNQSLATLEKLDRLIAERGPKDCLLTLKTHYLITMSEIDKARECNQQFLQSNPKHPIGMQHQAMICLAENDLPGAINALQDAMDGVKGVAVPVALGNAFRLVGLELLREGHPIAGRKHLSFARALNNDDQKAALLLIQSYRMPQPTQLLKQDLELPAAPSDQPWGSTFQQLLRLVVRGRWRTALQYLEVKLLPSHPRQATLLKARAILSLWLCDREKAIEAWSTYAAVEGLPHDAAVDAEMWVQALGKGDSSRTFEIQQYSIPLVNVDVALERLQSTDRIVSIQFEGYESEDGPPPKAAFVYLDRAALRSSDGLANDTVPRVVSEVLVFGRQTDRAARMEFDLVRDGSEAAVVEKLTEILGDSVDKNAGQPETVGEISEKEWLMTARWHLPSDVDRSQFAQWEQRHQEHLVLEVLPRIAVKALNDRSPLDVVGLPQYRIALEAIVGHLELADQLHAVDPTIIERLREKFGLPKPAPIDPRVDLGTPPTPLQRLRIQWELAPDELLASHFYYAMTAGHWQDLRAVGLEIRKRPTMESTVPFESLCQVLADISKDDEEGLNYIRQARKYAQAKGQPLGPWLVSELELRMKRGISDKTEELFEEIRMRHMNEPNVEPRLRRLLMTFGFGVPAGGETDSHAAQPETAKDDEQSSLWTPQSSAAAGTPGKLWIPGSD